MTAAESAREWRQLLRSHGLCIACKQDYAGDRLRCDACAFAHRGGPLLDRDPVRRLDALLSMDTSTMTRHDRLNHRFRVLYWRKRVAETKGNK